MIKTKRFHLPMMITNLKTGYTRKKSPVGDSGLMLRGKGLMETNCTFLKIQFV